MRPTPLASLLAALLAGAACHARAQESEPEHPDLTALAARAEEAMIDAADHFHGAVSVVGSYLWEYSTDFRVVRGENPATRSEGWIQPPGTPAVGEAYLDAYDATGDEFYAIAAGAVAGALEMTQLSSGGWDYRVDFDREKRLAWHTRRDVEGGDTEPGRRRHRSTYDDDTTQSALRFLIRYSRTVDEPDGSIGRAIRYGLDQAIAAQYANGAWPQIFEGRAVAVAGPADLRASVPEDWPRRWPGGDYRARYTLNDHLVRDMVRTLRLAGDEASLAAVRKAGEFLLAAQLPEPQPTWAQQYDERMHPAWARRFEPPAACTAESVGVVRTLLDLYVEGGDRRLADAADRAAAWFERSRLPDGRWARFHELGSNRPLYFDRAYRLTHDDGDLPTHYSFQGTYGIESMIADVRRIVADGGREAELARRAEVPDRAARRRRAEAMAGDVARIVAALDDRGRWVEDGWIRSRTFNRNLRQLARFVDLVRSLEE